MTERSENQPSRETEPSPFGALSELLRQTEALLEAEGREVAKESLGAIYSALQTANNSPDLSKWNEQGSLTQTEFDELNLRRKQLSNAIGIKTASGEIRHNLNKL